MKMENGHVSVADERKVFVKQSASVQPNCCNETFEARQNSLIDQKRCLRSSVRVGHKM